MSVAFVVLKLEGGSQIDPPQGVTGSRNSQGGIGLTEYFSDVELSLGELRTVTTLLGDWLSFPCIE